MKRRAFIAGLGGAAAWQLVAGAQQPTMPVIGYMSAGSPEGLPFRTVKFQQGLNRRTLFSSWRTRFSQTYSIEKIISVDRAE